jgi:hypothetical protein
LAFIFIPLPFVASFFGMNAKELGPDKNIKLWMFFATSTALTVTVTLTWELLAGTFPEMWKEGKVYKMYVKWRELNRNVQEGSALSTTLFRNTA